MKTTKQLVKEIWNHFGDKLGQKEIHWPNWTKEELERVMQHEMTRYMKHRVINEVDNG